MEEDGLRCKNFTSCEEDKDDNDLARSQFVTARNNNEEETLDLAWCQNVTSIMQTKGIKGGITSLPYAFNEQGVLYESRIRQKLH